MNEEICYITKEGKMAKKKCENNKSDFLQALYSAYKKLGQFFVHSYSLNCLKKNTSVLVKVMNT